MKGDYLPRVVPSSRVLLIGFRGKVVTPISCLHSYNATERCFRTATKRILILIGRRFFLEREWHDAKES
jgi:hypothetical protein